MSDRYRTCRWWEYAIAVLLLAVASVLLANAASHIVTEAVNQPREERS